ncbi:MAG: threonine ammonia-lyase [Filifactoraceae bacterium]
MLTLDQVYQAHHILKDVIRKTNLIETKNIAPDCQLFLKAENLQVTGSFKVRGAYYKISRLTKEQRERGIVACSAGNHAQGVALSAQKAGINSTIFIPAIAPISKVEATRNFGAKVELIDGVYDDAYQAATKAVEETGAEFIHPFNDTDVIAGQGTIALEILEQVRDLDAVVVPVGGGGLVSGIAFVIKALNPQCKVYGVQAQGAASMYTSIKNRSRLPINKVSTFADGIAVKCPGDITYELCEKYVDDIVTVTDDEIATAILALLEDQKLIAEGAGAPAVAAVMFEKVPVKGKRVCAIVSGGNIDVNILSKVMTRGLIRAGRISDVTIELLDKPGQLQEVSTIIAGYGANVVKVLHNHGGENTAITGCYLHITMETRDREHYVEVKNGLEQAGYKLMEGS